MNAPTLHYAYWRHCSGAVYAVKLATRDGLRVVVGAQGPLSFDGLLTNGREQWQAWLPYWNYQDNLWLARVLDDHQDEYEEVTP